MDWTKSKIDLSFPSITSIKVQEIVEKSELTNQIHSRGNSEFLKQENELKRYMDHAGDPTIY
jgi:hypothetical protein